MKALWLIGSLAARFATGEDPERGILESPHASARLRMGVAARDWKRRGNENVFWTLDVAGDGDPIDGDAIDVCIVPKYFYDFSLELWLDACRAARRSRTPLVLDICDYPFQKPPTVPAFYSETLEICDAVTVNSERMAELMAPHVPLRPLVIEDAILGGPAEPRFAPGDRLEIVWFGHHGNLPYLTERLDALARFSGQRACRLTVVTQDGIAIDALADDIVPLLSSTFDARFIPWSLENLRSALCDCDLVLIPSDPSHPLKAGASANRLAEALNAGRFAVASPLRSYLPFADAAWLGEDLGAGIGWALAHPGDVLGRIRAGQERVAASCAADAIGRQWCELFENLAG